jgi:hypothetical protein
MRTNYYVVRGGSGDTNREATKGARRGRALALNGDRSGRQSEPVRQLRFGVS